MEMEANKVKAVIWEENDCIFERNMFFVRSYRLLYENVVLRGKIRNNDFSEKLRKDILCF